MSEEDVRTGLHDAVADEPPLDFDPDVLVANARHQVKRRRTLVAAGVATAAVAVAGVAVPVALGRPPAHVVVADRPPAPPTTTTTTAPPTSTFQWPPPDVRTTKYTPDQLRTRGQEMKARLQEVVPGVLTGATQFRYSEFGGEAEGDFSAGQNYETAEVSYAVGGARYSIFFQIWAPGATDDLFDTACGGACQRIGDQDGGAVMARTDNQGAGLISLVYHFRANGCVVQVAAYNYDMGNTGATMPSIPMTVAQQATLATDPELGL